MRESATCAGFVFLILVAAAWQSLHVLHRRALIKGQGSCATHVCHIRQGPAW